MLQLYARRVTSGTRETLAGAFLAMSIGSRRSSSANVEFNGQHLVSRYTLQQDVPVSTGSGFRSAVELGQTKSVDAQYTYSGGWGRYTAEYSRFGSQNGIRVGATGSVGLVGGSMFAARQLGSSFAEVSVGDQAGVRVYAENQLIGVTGSDGKLMVPQLRAYEPNRIRIDDADLPMDASVASLEKTIRPYARTGNIVRFDVKVLRGALLRLVLPDGAALPTGAEVSLGGAPDHYLVVSDGEVYIPAIGPKSVLTAQWQGHRCTLDVELPHSNDPQPFLDHLVCRVEQYAAR
jgi:outer membrane usher protein